MPRHKHTLGLENIFCFHELFSPNFTFMGDMGAHIVDEEWLSEVILVVSERHGFEVQGHRSPTFNITNFIHACCAVGI